MNSIILEVTDRCNLNCTYCYFGGRKRKVNNMSKTIAEESIIFLLKNSPKDQRRFDIDFIGGEPFLNFPVIEHVMNICEKIKKDKGIFFNFRLTTNGTLMNDKIFSFIKNENTKIGISLDGNENSHNICRKFKDNNKGSHSVIIDNINKLNKINRYYGIHLTFHKGHSSVKSNLDYFNQIKIPAYSCVPAVFLDKTNSLQLDKSEIISFSNELVREFKDDILSKGNSKNFLLKDIFLRLLSSRNRIYPCNSGRYSYGISIDGSVYPCHRFFGAEEYKIGNIREGIDHKKEEVITRISVDERKECCNCEVRYFCGGTCYYESLVNMGNIHEKEPLSCAFSKTIIIGLLKTIIGLYKRNPEILQEIFKKISTNHQEKLSMPKKIDHIRTVIKNNDTMLERSGNAVLIDIGEEGLFFNKKDTSGKYIANATAMAIWDLIDGNRTAEEITQEIANVCEVEFDTIKDDIYGQLAAFQELGLVEEVAAASHA